MKQCVATFFFGLGNALLPFPLTYLVMSKKIKFKFSSLKIISLLLITAFFNGAVQKLIADTAETSNLLIATLQAILIPTIVSAGVIKIAHSFSSKK